MRFPPLGNLKNLESLYYVLDNLEPSFHLNIRVENELNKENGNKDLEEVQKKRTLLHQ